MYSVRFWSVQSIQQKVVIMELTQFSMVSLDGRSMRWKWRRWVWSTEEHVVEKNRVNEWSELCLERRFNASYFEEYPISLPDPPRNWLVLIFVKTGLEHISVVLPVVDGWMTADKIKWSRLCFADISQKYTFAYRLWYDDDAAIGLNRSVSEIHSYSYPRADGRCHRHLGQNLHLNSFPRICRDQDTKQKWVEEKFNHFKLTIMLGYPTGDSTFD